MQSLDMSVQSDNWHIQGLSSCPCLPMSAPLGSGLRTGIGPTVVSQSNSATPLRLVDIQARDSLCSDADQTESPANSRRRNIHDRSRTNRDCLRGSNYIHWHEHQLFQHLPSAQISPPLRFRRVAGLSKIVVTVTMNNLMVSSSESHRFGAYCICYEPLIALLV